MTTGELVKVERHRGRISLGRIIPTLKPGDLFQVTISKDGIITLKPVKVVPV